MKYVMCEIVRVNEDTYYVGLFRDFTESKIPGETLYFSEQLLTREEVCEMLGGG